MDQRSVRLFNADMDTVAVIVTPSSDDSSGGGYLDNSTRVLELLMLSASAANNSKPWPLLQQSPPVVAVLSLAYLLVFVFGIVNNCLLMLAVYRNKELRTVTNYFIVNLALADILVCTTMPITLLSNVFKGERLAL